MCDKNEERGKTKKLFRLKKQRIKVKQTRKKNSFDS